MANRTFDQSLLTIQKRIVSLWAVIAMPSGTTPVLQRWKYPSLNSGAGSYVAAATTGGGTSFPNRYVQGADGIFSVARTSPGLWTLTLQDSYQRLLSVSGNHSIAGGTANIVAITENTTITNIAAAGGSVIGIALLNATGTLADPTGSASSIIRIRLDLHDASEP